MMKYIKVHKKAIVTKEKVDFQQKKKKKILNKDKKK
jgi:hypothetical protein